MGFKPFPDVSEFAEFADTLREHRTESAQSLEGLLQHTRTNPVDGFGADDLTTASHVLEATLHDIDRAVEELRVRNEALPAARFDIEESSAIYRNLFERAPFAYVVTTARGLITFANDAACRLFGRPKNALVRKLLSSFVPFGERAAFREALARSCTSPAVASGLSP